MIPAEYLIYDETSPSGLRWLPGKGRGSAGASQVAGALHSDGYWKVKIGGRTYQAHRLVWWLHYGEPKDTIDHIDRNRCNNVVGNLRPANQSQQCCNRKSQPNTTGYRGVEAIRGGFRAQVTHRGHRYRQTFNTAEAANSWAVTKRAELHKEFAYAQC